MQYTRLTLDLCLHVAKQLTPSCGQKQIFLSYEIRTVRRFQDGETEVVSDLLWCCFLVNNLNPQQNAEPVGSVRWSTMDDSLHTFDENGIPLPKDKPPSARSAERRKKSDGRTSSRPKSTPAASLLNDSVEITSQNGELSDMFHMNGHGLDVTASFVVGEVRWDYMNKDRKLIYSVYVCLSVCLYWCRLFSQRWI